MDGASNETCDWSISDTSIVDWFIMVTWLHPMASSLPRLFSISNLTLNIAINLKNHGENKV